MGNSDSHLNRMDSSQQLSIMDQPPVNYNYPDMNVIFKGIPKMMQVSHSDYYLPSNKTSNDANDYFILFETLFVIKNDYILMYFYD